MGASQSTGIIERTAGLAAGQARTLTAALQRRLGVKVPPDTNILVVREIVAYLMNRCDKGRDGKTPIHRLQGRTTFRFWNVARRFSTCLPHQQKEDPENF